MAIEGQTKADVVLSIAVAQGRADINLGSCLVVKNLGSQILVGQPAKESHNIVTWPKTGKMTFENTKGESFTCSTLTSKFGDETIPKAVLKAVTDTHLFPEEYWSFQLPEEFQNTTSVIVTPRQQLVKKGFNAVCFKVNADRVININPISTGGGHICPPLDKTAIISYLSLSSAADTC